MLVRRQFLVLGEGIAGVALVPGCAVQPDAMQYFKEQSVNLS
jgi:hypothetical protein